MKLIVGLGNPGDEYKNTRHNCGFMVLDKVLKELNLTLDKKKYKSLYTAYNHKGEKILFVEPQTYMNLSGEAVSKFVNFYNLTSEDILVIHDDLDLPVGKLRLRKSGSSAGQKGMGNIIDLLNTKDIKRIRVGISNNKTIETADYVLGKVSGEDKPIFDESIIKAKDAVIFYLDHDFEATMNKFNQ